MSYDEEFQKIDLLIVELKRCAEVLKKYPNNALMRGKYDALRTVIDIHLQAIPDTLTMSFAHWEATR